MISDSEFLLYVANKFGQPYGVDNPNALNGLVIVEHLKMLAEKQPSRLIDIIRAVEAAHLDAHERRIETGAGDVFWAICKKDGRRLTSKHPSPEAAWRSI